MLRRALLTGLLTAAVLITASFSFAPVSSEAGVQHFRRHGHSVPIALDGLNQTAGQMSAWYRGLAANEARVRAELEAAQSKLRARNLASARPNPSPARAGGVNWDGIANCETGGNWSHQTQFDGGLGIYHGAWTDFGGREFAPYGSQATKEQQIIVAERIYARYGLSGWGCKAYG